MDTISADAGKNSNFELPAPLTFQKIFQSYPYWRGVSQGFIPKVVKCLRRSLDKHSFLLDVDDRQLVLSVAAEPPPSMPLQGHPFDPFIEHAADAGIGPKLVFKSMEQGFMVTEFVEGRCWRSEDFRNMANIERLSQLLKKLHVLPNTREGFSTTEAVNYYWQRMRGEYAKLPKRLEVLQSRMNRVIEYANVHFNERTICHNNLLNTHVIETNNGLKLVGWEHAGINDPFYDLAVIVHNHGFNERKLNQLLYCYTGQNDGYERERFYYSYAIYMYLNALSCWLRFANKPESHHEEQIEGMTDVLVALLHQIGN